MSTMATIRPANAGAVTRILKAAGMRHGQAHTTMVKGYHTFTTGVTCEQEMDTSRVKVQRGRYADGTARHTWLTNNTPTGHVIVSWQFGRVADTWSPQQRKAETATQMRVAAEVLRGKGFDVEEIDDQYEITLRVCRRDDEGRVVQF